MFGCVLVVMSPQSHKMAPLLRLCSEKPIQGFGIPSSAPSLPVSAHLSALGLSSSPPPLPHNALLQSCFMTLWWPNMTAEYLVQS